ncbi:MAG TPA: hypothetical protein V6C97_24570 [Oculatellaceae cyanobacterium]
MRIKVNVVLSTVVFVWLWTFSLSTQYARCAETNSAKENIGSRIVAEAKSSLGKEVWRGYGLPNGKLGCAAALCNVLKKAGISEIKTPMVTTMRRQLLASPLGCTERIIRNGSGTQIDDTILLKDCRPGDIILAFNEPPSKLNGGANAHCGIMGQNTQVYTNNWMDGIWTEVEIHQMFDYFPYIRLLRLGGGRTSNKQS